MMSFFIRHRKAVAVSVGAIMLLLEVGEHLITENLGEAAHRLFDVGLYLFLVPAFVLLLLGALSQAEHELKLEQHAHGLQYKLSQRLGKASSRQDLVQCILEFSHETLPAATATLYSFNMRDMGIQTEGLCAPDGVVVFSPKSEDDEFPAGSLPQLLTQNGGGRLVEGGQNSANASVRYDLPLTRSGQRVGVLKLEFPTSGSPAAEEIRAVKSALPLMALALDAALLQDLAASQAAASQVERQKIAQNLHDSLAQNISYLRLKLDQLTGENAIHEIGVVLQELEHMRASADEAYQQVRSTLDELAVDGSEDLSTILEIQARTISERSGFVLRTSRSGAAFPLPASTRQHILYITREAFHNIEKHAQAQVVYMQMIWLEHELILKITDDGVGFDPHKVSEAGHYGLWIMQQRAMELGGSLKIVPAEERGTEVTLWVPCPLPYEAAVRM